MTPFTKPRRRHTRAILGVCLMLLMLRCDSFEAEPSAGKVEFNGPDAYTLYANGEVYLGVSEMIKSNTQVRVKYELHPGKGYIRERASGNIDYVARMNELGVDTLTLKVTDRTSDETFAIKDIVFTILPGSSACNYYPVADSIYGLIPFVNSSVAYIQPSHNDLLCFDKYTVSIYKPDDSFMPHNGTVYIESGERFPDIVHYQSRSLTPAADTIMYKVMDINNPGNVAYGMIYISARECNTVLRDDFFEVDSRSGPVVLDPLGNDDVCTAMDNYFSSLDVVVAPLHGTVAVKGELGGYAFGAPGGHLIYTPRSTENWEYDELVYNACDYRECMTAKIAIYNSTSPCNLGANDDFATSGTEQVSLDVLANDSFCGESVSIRILSQPMFGSATVDQTNNTIVYRGRNGVHDSMLYEICSSQQCKRASVYLRPE